VVALDDVSTGSVDNVPHLLDHARFTLRQGTVLDHPLVAQLAGRADVVVHLAAAVGVKLMVEKPLQSLITDIRGTETHETLRPGAARVLLDLHLSSTVDHGPRLRLRLWSMLVLEMWLRQLERPLIAGPPPHPDVATAEQDPS
jgi:hypothetical protein